MENGDLSSTARRTSLTLPAIRADVTFLPCPQASSGGHGSAQLSRQQDTPHVINKRRAPEPFPHPAREPRPPHERQQQNHHERAQSVQFHSGTHFAMEQLA